MITDQQINDVIGSTAVGPDGKHGSVGEVFLDDETGRPEWATVRTGLFGTKEAFVPLADATVSGGELRLPYDKAKVKGAPHVDVSTGHLSPQEEQELYRYYGLGHGSGGTAGQTTGTTDTGRMENYGTGQSSEATDTRQTGNYATGQATGTTDTGQAGTYASDRTRTDQDLTTAGAGTAGTTGTAGHTDRDRDGVRDDLETRGAVGHDTSGPTTDNAMTRSEEHLNVGTQRVEAGRARLRKYVVSENVTETVPVSREEVRVEREPITDANVGNAMDGPAISEEEHEVVLHAEQPVVSKEATPVERVRLDTQTVTEQQQVSDQVRKEQIEVDDDPSTRRR
ncbi:PRC and DUF2382 domain-containing protein [Geodermatophilus aquaeductus]|uniref:Conserved domain-containing protein n=1 Tax=Geodermatophilus aquaeductus TaxID=1564161 RepID=A0A521DBU0_9ACTN|nr:PRC and DUF2382 domain-containing protein [Geodermatophilus aquaeductus]SMO68611.1 conserved domain-containing protein [Geodermatophilus aquaeductus]